MTRQQASNCLTLAYLIADCMSDAEFRRFWHNQLSGLTAHPDLFPERMWYSWEEVTAEFGAAGEFVVSGELFEGLGIAPGRITRVAVATALVAVCDFAGWVDGGDA